MMKPISHSLRDVLVRQGIANAKPVGAGKVRANESPALSTTASSGECVADAHPGGREHPPIGRQGGARQPMGISGKGREREPAPVQQGGNVRFGQSRSPVLVVHENPNMSDMPMRQTTQTPRAVAPRGVVSLMVIIGGKA